MRYASLDPSSNWLMFLKSGEMDSRSFARAIVHVGGNMGRSRLAGSYAQHLCLTEEVQVARLTKPTGRKRGLSQWSGFGNDGFWVGNTSVRVKLHNIKLNTALHGWVVLTTRWHACCA